MIIGIVGRSRVGKDTTANIIMSCLPQYKIIRLAQPIKDAVSAIYGIPKEVLETDAKEQYLADYQITPRMAMQEITAHYIKKHGQDFFTKIAFKKLTENSDVIIPDVRFPYDCAEISKHRGIVIKVVRPQNNVHHTVEDTVESCPFDYLIVNDTTIQDLHSKINDIIIRAKL